MSKKEPTREFLLIIIKKKFRKKNIGWWDVTLCTAMYRDSGTKFYKCRYITHTRQARRTHDELQELVEPKKSGGKRGEILRTKMAEIQSIQIIR